MNNWVFEKSYFLPEEATKQIREELKSIRLKEGNCIVCNSNFVASDTFENGIKILEKNKAQVALIQEFMKDFAYTE